MRRNITCKLNLIFIIQNLTQLLARLTLAIGLLMFGSSAFATKLNCEELEGFAKSELNYKYRKNGERCEGMLTKLKSANANSFFHLKSAVLGQIDYDLKSDERLFVSTRIDERSITGPLELIGESLSVSTHYRLYSRIDPNTEFSWSTKDVLRRQRIQDVDLGILARTHKSNLSGPVMAGTDDYLYVPVNFYSENKTSDANSLTVTFISANDLSDVEIFDDCTRDNPELVFTTDYGFADELVQLALRSKGCDSNSVTINLPSANNNVGESQTFNILR